MNTSRTEINYFPNGQVWTIKNFNSKNELHGEYKRFHENGALELTIDYKRNKMNGSWTEYYENGNIHEESKYANNKKNGMSNKYSVNKSLISSSQYLNDRVLSNKLYAELVFKNLHKYVFLMSEHNSRQPNIKYPPHNEVYGIGSKFMLNNKHHFEIIKGSIILYPYIYTFDKSNDFQARELTFDVDNVDYKISKWNEKNINKMHGIATYSTMIKPNGKIIKNFTQFSTKKQKPIAEENTVCHDGFNNNQIMMYKECKLYVLSDSIEELEIENEYIKNYM